MKHFLNDFKEKICALLGWLAIVGGILSGLWICCYTMFYGGIVQIITGIQYGGDTMAFAIAAGICKILFCELGLVIPMILGFAIGCFFLDKSY